MDKEQQLEDLSGEQLVSLAMLAFIHMYNVDDRPKEELLGDIILWFKTMTMELNYDVVDVEPLGGRRH